MAYTHHESIAYETRLAKGELGSEVVLKETVSGSASVTGSLVIATGLTTVDRAVACLAQAPSLDGCWVAVTNISGGDITVAVYRPTAANDCTPIAAIVAVNIYWIAQGEL